MNNILTGQRVTSPDGKGEVLTVFDDKVVIKLDSGAVTTMACQYVTTDQNSQTFDTDIANEPQEQKEARAAHADEILARLDNTEENNQTLNNNQLPMEISENTLDTINNLIKINNDRIAGFEKAAKDVEDDASGIVPVFTKLAGESRQYVIELTGLAQQSGGDIAEGTSASGDMHRAWIDIKSTFTGSDLLAILNECERGEDAAKVAYSDALNPENELNSEVAELLQAQQSGIKEGHDLIKSLRDQARINNDDNDQKNDEEGDEDYNGLNNTPITPEVSTEAFPSETEYQNDNQVAEPSYEGAAGEYQQKTNFISSPEANEQEETWEEERTPATNNSKLMEFFVNELKDLLWAEKELVDTLPDMAEAATSQELKNAFTNHLAETEVHVNRLEEIFGMLGIEPDTTKCDAMAGIVDEGDEIISDTEEGTAQRDVGLIFAGQKAEHYEIASYGGMISLAKTLGYSEIAELLVQTIEEEKNADALLTEIAENHINYEASIEPSSK